ncbi:MAG: arabinofuranosyltransferase [Gordonia sp. (in: high G+C Gram-positive bacteria)]|uniref:arabinofuranosyltransferase n=1 Tax=Gordonia sp. (in: high G+C Gram-positive bacteria) TaxID=84139 RepID=UPI0039E57E6E
MSAAIGSTSSTPTTALRLAAALVGGAALSWLGLFAIGTVDWPAYNASNVLRALTTVGQVGAVAVLLVAVLLYRRNPDGNRLLPDALAAIGMSGLVTVTLGMPLAATKLYLFGLSVDQQFRVEYLTRLTSSAKPADMTYDGLAPFYPGGWFWLGGRYANLTGAPGWEAYKPWAIITIAAAAALAVVLWNRMIGADRGIAVSLAVTLAVLAYAAPEPYAAVLILLGVALLPTILGALRGPKGVPVDGLSLSSTRWLAVLVAGAFLGLCATFYTLYAGLFALTAALLALWLAGTAWVAAANKSVPKAAIRKVRRRALTVYAGRLAAMAVVAGAIALVHWGPYLAARLRHQPASGGTYEHYLPESGAVLPFPMLKVSAFALLTLVGLVWVIWRFRERTIALALGTAVVAVYLLCLASMALTATGTTLLAFRLEPVLVAILAAAGVLGLAQASSWAVERYGDVRFLIGAVATIAAIAVAQHVPSMLSGDISIAYTDTDGKGERADLRPAGAAAYYPQVHKLIGEQTGKADADLVVLTADFDFLSIYPYWGFQGLTSHYANPLAEFDKRAAAIERWSKATSTDEMIKNLDASPWRAPDAFLFRHSADGYALKLARDVYPNDPNVKRYTVTFDQAAFAGPEFTVTEIGPFVLVVRNRPTR